MSDKTQNSPNPQIQSGEQDLPPRPAKLDAAKAKEVFGGAVTVGAQSAPKMTAGSGSTGPGGSGSIGNGPGH